MKQSAEKLAAAARHLDQWMRKEAWPLWWSAGRHENGSFFESLDYSGQAVPDDIARVRVQARQIYSFALAWQMGWRDEASLPSELARSLDRYFDTCLGPEGLPGTLVDIEAGEMTDPTPNLYVTAFTLLALAQCKAIFNSVEHDLRIARLIKDIDRHLAYADGSGYRETLPPDTARHQNPHMHFYESLLCLYLVTGDKDVAKRAERLFEFVRNTFFDGQYGVVWEHLSDDPAKDEQHYEPGHSLEWVWLIGLRSRLFNKPLDPSAVRLYETCLASGYPEGETPMRLTFDHQPVDPTRRLWSQTEALKAHLCILELGPKHLAGTALKRAVVCSQSILDTWLDTDCRGIFYDQFDADGKLIAENVPGSMGYHLYVAIAELTRFVERATGA